MPKEIHGSNVKRSLDTRSKGRLLAFAACPVCLVLSAPSYAYVDPATGSMILQGLLAGVAIAMGALRFYWAKVKSFFSRAQTRVAADGPVGSETAPEDSKVRRQT